MAGQISLANLLMSLTALTTGPADSRWFPIAQKVIYVDSDGPLSRDYRNIPYARINRPIWPLDVQTTPGLIV